MPLYSDKDDPTLPAPVQVLTDDARTNYVIFNNASYSKCIYLGETEATADTFGDTKGMHVALGVENVLPFDFWEISEDL